MVRLFDEMPKRRKTFFFFFFGLRIEEVKVDMTEVVKVSEGDAGL